MLMFTRQTTGKVKIEAATNEDFKNDNRRRRSKLSMLKFRVAQNPKRAIIYLFNYLMFNILSQAKLLRINNLVIVNGFLRVIK